MAYTLIQLFFRIFTFVIIIDVLISFFLPPHNRFRQVLDSFVNPLLEPIRRIIPPIYNLDFSPVILLIGIQLVEYIILRFL